MTRPTIPIIGRTEIDAGEKKLSAEERKAERERQARVRAEERSRNSGQIVPISD